jgi:hypothetical protein
VAGVPLAIHCLRYEYVCGAGAVRGFVPVFLVCLFVVDFLVSHALADGCLTGRRGRHVLLLVCCFRFVLVLAHEACRVAYPLHVSLRAAGYSILPGRINVYLSLALVQVVCCVMVGCRRCFAVPSGGRRREHDV